MRLMDMAVAQKDYAAQSMLKWFIDEQVEEEDTVRKILDKLTKMDNNPIGLAAIDRELGKRE